MKRSTRTAATALLAIVVGCGSSGQTRGGGDAAAVDAGAASHDAARETTASHSEDAGLTDGHARDAAAARDASAMGHDSRADAVSALDGPGDSTAAPADARHDVASHDDATDQREAAAHHDGAAHHDAVARHDAARDAGPPTGIDISGNALLRDGQPWQPKGVSMIGALTEGSAVTAYSHWGSAELAAAKSYGADAMRLQVSQPALDPQSSSYSAAYLTRLESMVSLAEASGFAIILCMQDQSLAGGDADPLPTASTQRAWAALGPVYADDPWVIYELYNEPQNEADSAGWANWQNGMTGTVGHQALLTGLRSLGAKNAMLVDGAQYAEVLTGAPALTDPLQKYGYATHPYYLDAEDTDSSAWESRFGFLAATYPVVVSEWDAASNSSDCESDAPTLSPELITFINSHNIGIFGWAFDLPDTLVVDWSWTPTTFDNYTCGTAGDGAGALLKSDFAM